LRSNEDMKVFARRVLALEARSVSDEAGLNAMISNYSGVAGKKDLESMKAALRAAPWVAMGLGHTSPLTEQDYQKLLSLKSPPQTKAFIRRVLDREGRKVADEEAFKGFVLGLSLKVPGQSLGELQRRLQSVPWVVPVLNWHLVSGTNAPLTEEGYQSVAKLENNKQMEDYVRRLIAEEARFVKDEGNFLQRIPYISGVDGVLSLDVLKAQIRDPVNSKWIGESVGRTAPLTEAGYQEVAAQKSDVQMKAFFRRLLVADGKRSSDEEVLKTIVPYFSGRLGVQSLELAKEKLQSVPCVMPVDR